MTIFSQMKDSSPLHQSSILHAHAAVQLNITYSRKINILHASGRAPSSIGRQECYIGRRNNREDPYGPYNCSCFPVSSGVTETTGIAKSVPSNDLIINLTKGTSLRFLPWRSSPNFWSFSKGCFTKLTALMCEGVFSSLHSESTAGEREQAVLHVCGNRLHSSTGLFWFRGTRPNAGLSLDLLRNRHAQVWIEASWARSDRVVHSLYRAISKVITWPLAIVTRKPRDDWSDQLP